MSSIQTLISVFQLSVIKCFFIASFDVAIHLYVLRVLLVVSSGRVLCMCFWSSGRVLINSRLVSRQYAAGVSIDLIVFILQLWLYS